MTDVILGPATVNLVGIVENDNWSLAMTVTVNGSPVDLTGQTIVAAIKSGSVSYPLTIVITNAVAGQLTLSQSHAPRLDSYSATWAMRVGGRTMMAGNVSGVLDTLS